MSETNEIFIGSVFTIFQKRNQTGFYQFGSISTDSVDRFVFHAYNKHKYFKELCFPCSLFSNNFV